MTPLVSALVAADPTPFVGLAVAALLLNLPAAGRWARRSNRAGNDARQD